MSIHRTRTGKWEVRYREGRRNRSKTFDLVFRTYAHSIKAMRGRPSTSIAEAISAARADGNSGKPAGYEALAHPGRSKLG
jgi:hypothetical protein